MAKIRVDMEAVERARAALKALPTKPSNGASKTEAVAMLAADLRRLRNGGYSWEDLAKLLTENAFEISPDGLKTMLRRSKDDAPAKRAKPSKVSRGTGGRQSGPPSPPPPPPPSGGRFNPKADRAL